MCYSEPTYDDTMYQIRAHVRAPGKKDPMFRTYWVRVTPYVPAETRMLRIMTAVRAAVELEYGIPRKDVFVSRPYLVIPPSYLRMIPYHDDVNVSVYT